MRKLNARHLATYFILAAAGLTTGCAVLDKTDPTSCIRQKGLSGGFSVPLLTASFDIRNDEDSPTCLTVRAVDFVGSLKKADGTPDPRAQALAVESYKSGSDEFRRIMDARLKTQGTSIREISFAVEKEKPLVCKKTGADSFQCVKVASLNN